MILQHYRILVLPEAEDDIKYTYRYIAFELFQPMTAKKYRRGIHDTINHLSRYGGMFAVSLNPNLQRQYGPEVRTAKYKKMAIVYTLMNDLIIIHRVIAGSLVL